MLLGNGDGTFQPAPNFPGGGISVAVGDFNGDGHLDIAVANSSFAMGNSSSYYVSVLLGNGDGTFQPIGNFPIGTSFFSVPSQLSVAVGDFNGDGRSDLAVVWLGGVRVLLGNGDGSFQTPPFSYIAGNGPISVAVGDFNGDGFPDLAVANSGSGDVSILLNDGKWAP